jgi:catechol 2,3-dioxygenase-like lactoylglutathione lyase family enzyme
MSIRVYAITFDAHDPARLAAFWCHALGYRIALDTPEEVAIRAPDHEDLPVMFFLPVPQDKSGKNRLHLDLEPDDQEAAVERLLALGARRADIGQKDVDWVVMVDPEGNEFCVLPQRG